MSSDDFLRDSIAAARQRADEGADDGADHPAAHPRVARESPARAVQAVHADRGRDRLARRLDRVRLLVGLASVMVQANGARARRACLDAATGQQAIQVFVGASPDAGRRSAAGTDEGCKSASAAIGHPEHGCRSAEAEIEPGCRGSDAEAENRGRCANAEPDNRGRVRTPKPSPQTSIRSRASRRRIRQKPASSSCPHLIPSWRHMAAPTICIFAAAIRRRPSPRGTHIRRLSERQARDRCSLRSRTRSREARAMGGRTCGARAICDCRGGLVSPARSGRDPGRDPRSLVAIE